MARMFAVPRRKRLRREISVRTVVTSRLSVLKGQNDFQRTDLREVS